MTSSNLLRSHRNRPSELGNCGISVVRAGKSTLRSYDAHSGNPTDTSVSAGVEWADNKQGFCPSPQDEGPSMPDTLVTSGAQTIVSLYNSGYDPRSSYSFSKNTSENSSDQNIVLLRKSLQKNVSNNSRMYVPSIPRAPNNIDRNSCLNLHPRKQQNVLKNRNTVSRRNNIIHGKFCGCNRCYHTPLNQKKIIKHIYKKRKIISKIITEVKRQKLNHTTDTTHKQSTAPVRSKLQGGDRCYHKSSNSNTKINISKNIKRRLPDNSIQSNKRRKINGYNRPTQNKISAYTPIPIKISKHSDQQTHSRAKKRKLLLGYPKSYTGSKRYKLISSSENKLENNTRNISKNQTEHGQDTIKNQTYSTTHATKLQDVPTPNASSSVQPKAFNTIKIFGVFRMKNINEFLKYCKTNRIPCIRSYIHEFKTVGYKSKRFDSRSVQITLRAHTIALQIHYKLLAKHIGHTCIYKTINDSGKRISENIFSIISDTAQTSVSHAFPKKRPNYIIIATWNIQSITKKSAEIIDFIKQEQIDIMALTETRWSGQKLNLPNDYIWIGQKCNSKSCGGVGFIIHTSVINKEKIKVIDDAKSNTLFLHIKGSSRHRSTVFSVVYCPASPTKAESELWWKEYQEIIAKLNSEIGTPFDIVMLGDFNGRIGNPRTENEKTYIGRFGENTRDKAGENIINFIDQNNLISLNNRRKLKTGTNYTYHQQGKVASKSIIDLILISKGMFRNEYHTKILQETLTGHESHFPVLAEIKFQRNIIKQRKKFTTSTWNVPLLKDKSKSNLFSSERDKCIEMWLKSSTIQEQSFINCFETAANKSIGKVRKTYLNKKGIVKRKTQKAIEIATKQYKHMKKLCTNIETTNLPKDKTYEYGKKLTILKQRIDNLRKVEKLSELKKVSKKINDSIKSKNSQELFESAKTFIQPKKFTEINAMTDKNGKTSTNVDSILDILRESWKECFKRRKKNKHQNFNTVRNTAYNKYCYENLSKNEIINSLKSLKIGTSQGIDGIPPEFLKDITDTLIDGIHKLFNSIFKSGIFPSAWKIDRKTPIYKAGNKLDPSNYRPIAVHSVFRKLYCKILHDRLNNIIDLHENQYGFIKEKRCSDHAAVITNMILNNKKNKKYGELIIAVFDFSKAFDSCDHELLFAKLKNSGVNGPLLQIISSIYDNARYKVCIQGKYSEVFDMQRGVAQGCKLSTLLFNLYINDMLKLLSPVTNPKCIPLCYADDLIVATTSRKEMANVIMKLDQWCKENYIEINAKKSKIMTINSPKHAKINFKISDHVLPVVNEIKYLGFTITNTGSWESHITTCINKTYGLSYRWKALLQCSDIPYNIRIRIADSMIISHLTYGEEIFALNITQTKKLQSAENHVIKTIFNLPKQTSTAAILHLTGRLSAKYRLQLRRLTNYCRLHRNKLTNLKKIFENKSIINTSGSLVKQTMNDLSVFSNPRTLRSHKQKLPTNIITDTNNYNMLKCKNVLKKYIRIQNDISNYRTLQTNDLQILSQLNSRTFNPNILQLVGKKLDKLTAWKLGISQINRNPNHAKNIEAQQNICILCNLENNYPIQQHLLTDCPATTVYLQQFYDTTKRISGKSYKALCKLHNNKKWIWILNPDGLHKQQIFRQTHPIIEGIGITPNRDKRDQAYNAKAIKEHNAIISGIPKNSLIIYSDGSTISSNSGSGALILYNSNTEAKLKFTLQNCENNFAELFAIYKSIKYIQSNIHKKLNRNIHIFTDSRYSIEALTMATRPKNNHLLINQIINEVSTKNAPTLVLHWIPSHVSYTENGIRYSIEGNEIADQLAKQAAYSRSGVLDVYREYVDIPRRLLYASADLVSAIDNLALRAIESSDSTPVGPSPDDFSYSDATQSTLTAAS